MTRSLTLALPALIRDHDALAFAVLAFVLYGVFVYAREWWRVRSTKTWLTTDGTIYDVRNECQITARAGEYWRVSFRYGYKVDEVEHTGKYSVNCVSEELGNHAAECLAESTAVVHYDPKQPAKSVLWEKEVWKLY